ncbi:MAG: hypothetical protein AB1439_12510 [candidate division FCPU426 bacterium]
MEDTIAKICRAEYKVQVQVKASGTTIGALVVTPNSLLKDLSFSDQALNKIENVMLTTSRVTLSSQFPYEFFVVTLRDPTLGVEVSFVRYIKDIRRLIMDDISRTDYFQRLLIDVRAETPAEAGNVPMFAPKAWRLSEFLSRQIAERVRTQLQASLVGERLFKLQGVRGEFAESDLSLRNRTAPGRFRLILDFTPGTPPFDSLATPSLREDLLQVILSVAQLVVRRYEFTTFDGLEIVDSQGRQLTAYDRSVFSKDSMNTLMEMIRSLQKKQP